MVKLSLNKELTTSKQRLVDYRSKVKKTDDTMYSTLSENKEVCFKHTLLGTILHAWNYHYDLTLKPDDLWTSIALSLSKYISHNAEQLRSVFVDHEGKKELVAIDIGSAATYDWTIGINKLAKLVDSNINDKHLIGSMTNNFTTTTHITRSISKLAILKSMEQYFDYKMMLLCGIPSIELKGTKEDWIKLKEKISSMFEYDVDKKLISWCELLHQLVDKFIEAFDGIEDKTFWNTIVHESGGSGPSYIGGWISVLNPFDDKMNYILGPDMFTRIEDNNISDTLVNVDFKIDDNGNEFDAKFQGGFYGATIVGNTIEPYIGIIVTKKSPMILLIKIIEHNHLMEHYENGHKESEFELDEHNEKYFGVDVVTFSTCQDYKDSKYFKK